MAPTEGDMSRSQIFSYESVPTDARSRLSAAFFAALLGTFLVIGVGLTNADTLHSAAHDTRHAFSFPCH